MFLLSPSFFLLFFPSGFHGLYLLCCPSTMYEQEEGRSTWDERDREWGWKTGDYGRLGQSKAGWWRKEGCLLKRRLNIGISYTRGKASLDENNIKKEGSDCLGEWENWPWLQMKGEAGQALRNQQSYQPGIWRPPGEAEPSVKARKEGWAGKNPHLKA